MTFNHLISLCNPITVTGPEPERIGGITHDSRAVEYDYVFVAMKGFETDGHQFIPQAIENGAQTIIHEKEISDPDPGTCYVQVEDTRALLGYLAQAYYDNPADKLTIHGITGTNGKTTVTTLIYQMLRKLKERPALTGTNGTIIEDNHIDNDLTTEDAITLAETMHDMIQAGCTHLVMEVSSHALEQKRTNGIYFTSAGFTNLSHDHLDYHGSMEAYMKAKKLLFDGLDENATAIVNGDDEYSQSMLQDCSAEILQFGFTTEQPIRCQILSHSLGGLEIQVEDQPISSPLCGRFNAYNLAIAYLLGRTQGYSESELAEALSKCQGAEGRLQRLNNPSDEEPTVYVDYAHTPSALQNVLETLKELKAEDQQLHVAFGCGGDRDKEKRPQMAQIAERIADQIMVTSDNPRSEDPDSIIDDIMTGFAQPGRIRRQTERREAIEQIIGQADSNDLILLAGKGHETYQIIDDQRREFDDRDVARQALTQETNARNGEVA